MRANPETITKNPMNTPATSDPPHGRYRASNPLMEGTPTERSPPTSIDCEPNMPQGDGYLSTEYGLTPSNPELECTRPQPDGGSDRS